MIQVRRAIIDRIEKFEPPSVRAQRSCHGVEQLCGATQNNVTNEVKRGIVR
jgi:hypothetical protein